MMQPRPKSESKKEFKEKMSGTFLYHFTQTTYRT